MRPEQCTVVWIAVAVSHHDHAQRDERRTSESSRRDGPPSGRRHRNDSRPRSERRQEQYQSGFGICSPAPPCPLVTVESEDRAERSEADRRNDPQTERRRAHGLDLTGGGSTGRVLKLLSGESFRQPQRLYVAVDGARNKVFPLRRSHDRACAQQLGLAVPTPSL